MADIPVEVGDRVLALGVRRPDGSLDVEKLWVNPVNLMGPIEAVSREGAGWRLRVKDRYLGSVEVRVDPRTEIGTGPGLVAPLAQRPVQWSVGQHIQVVGRRLRDGTVLAATLDMQP